MSLLIKQIEKMDKTSQEFVDLVGMVNEKYFEAENPDEYQQAAIILNDILMRGEEWMVIAMFKIGLELFELKINGGGARTGEMHFDRGNGLEKLFFNIYDKPESLDHLRKVISNSVIVQAKKDFSNDPNPEEKAE